jgi:hypothetical protein
MSVTGQSTMETSRYVVAAPPSFEIAKAKSDHEWLLDAYRAGEI